MLELKIDPEFRDKIPPLTDAEFEQLKENVLNDGEVYEPICVWNGTIVDGHNRWKIIQEHPEIPYRVKEMDFADKWAAFEWMYRKQLGRRNLTEQQKAYMIGKMYEARKNTQGGDRRSEEFSNGQNVHLKERREIKDGTSGEIGKEFGIDGKTVRRNAQFAQGLDAIADVSKEAADKILKGESGVTKTEVSEIRDASAEEVKDFAESVVNGTIKEKHRPKSIGNTKEIRDRMKLANEVISEMYSPEIKEFTIEMLESDIELNGMEYVSVLRNTLTDHSTMLFGENRGRVAKKIDSIVAEIQKIRRLVE